MSSPLFWLLLSLGCIAIHFFASMSEMAIVSLNRVRLQYYVSQKSKRALWISYLLYHPAHLFGTTVFLINLALLIGSECARRFYQSIGLDPNLAILTQSLLVIIFGDTVPLLAARTYAESAAMIGAPIIYGASLVLKPFTWIFHCISGLINRLVKGSASSLLTALSREELQHLVEQHDQGELLLSDQMNVNALVKNLFDFRLKTAKDALSPLHLIQMLPASATVGQMRTLLEKTQVPCIPLYSPSRTNILAIALPRDLVNAPDQASLKELARAPWFITLNSPLMQILQQFRHNNQSVAVVLDHEGLAAGLITLDDLLEEIFGAHASLPLRRTIRQAPKRHLAERNLPGEMKIEAFNTQYDATLPAQHAKTLAALVSSLLGRPPLQGDSVRICGFELTVVETTFLDIKTINVKSIR